MYVLLKYLGAAVVGIPVVLFLLYLAAKTVFRAWFNVRKDYLNKRHIGG